MLGTLLAGAFVAGSLAVASPAWGATQGSDTASGCHLVAAEPTAPRGTLNGIGRREHCSDVVTYFWVRIYKAIPAWPDSEKAVIGRTYVQNTELSAKGPCDGEGDYYTHTSTATGLSGDSVESPRASLC
ncbi:hypothetical protein [Actinophytocola sp. KF-1]